MASLVSIPHFHIVVVLTFQANIIVSVFGSPVDPKVSIELVTVSKSLDFIQGRKVK